ncbi:restriction endonuclease subunit S [Flavobacterium sp. F52]|uniref:restriction endonuclease subunit S n=1 Tax=Flavobacterium sp. F52 TaxID=1202532 RepID=UPI0002730900|nr:restriction endonuclease subunit S [Flavobacterium sp. F52]EJG02012.1 restriction modification system DNA specificity domain-containing protein [Flavobacterium sp. F52]
MVKSKYKVTDIGMFPEDWEIKEMLEIISEISMGPFGSDIKVSNFVNKGVPVLNGYNVSGIKLKERYSNFVTPEKAKSLKKAVAKKGDIVVTHRGTIGQIAYISEDSTFEKYVISQSQFRFSVNKVSALYQYIVLFFHSDKGQNIILESKGHTGVPAIAQATTTFKKFKIPLPSLPEQQIIIEVLSDTNTLTESLEKFISKKQFIKQGILQTLLTPKENWEVKKLGEITEISKGKNLSKNLLNCNGKFNCILYGELFTTYKEVINNVMCRTNYADSIKSVKGDILFPGSTTTKGIDLAKASTILKNDVLLGGDIIVVRKKNYEYNSIFLTYFLNVIKKYEIAQKTRGITIHHLYGNDLKDIEVLFPTLEEQTQIATILTDLEDEIQNLEKKLQKAKQLKQGMMQQLLTGKIRLVNTLQTS